MAKTKKRVRSNSTKSKIQRYELNVSLLSGPLTEAFAKRNPRVLRTIEIRGDQTLEDLHNAIFDAFDRFEHHMYEFQIGGKRPHDPKARRYSLALMMQDDCSENAPAGDVAQTRIDALDLRKKSKFTYWFDFGDDWWHLVQVVAIHDDIPRGRYPRITQRVGKSPPQYANLDDEEDDENGEEADDADETA